METRIFIQPFLADHLVHFFWITHGEGIMLNLEDLSSNSQSILLGSGVFCYKRDSFKVINNGMSICNFIV